MKQELLVFENELKAIKHDWIRDWAIKALEMLPDYFWKVPASSTGKYHPSYSLGEGGLVRHTRSAVRIALELFNNNTVQDFNDVEKDLIICTLLLHDGVKHGIKYSKYTVATHPTEVAILLTGNEELIKSIDERLVFIIMRAIRSHMGQWNTDYKSKKEILPKPETELEKFVHLCDYLSSRKCLEMNFEVPISR